MERKDFVVRIGDELIPVEAEIYAEYYRSRRRERTQREKDARNRLLYYDAWDNEDGPGADVLRCTAPPPEDLVLAETENERLRKCLESLPDEERGLINALFFLEKPLARLARELNIPRKTLEYRRDRALAKLRRMLEDT